MIADRGQLFVAGNLATKVLCLSLKAATSEVLSHDLHLLSDEPPEYALLKLTQNVPTSGRSLAWRRLTGGLESGYPCMYTIPYTCKRWLHTAKHQRLI